MAISVAVAVGEGTADRLVATLSQRVKNLRIDHSQNGEADMGPLITAAHRERVRRTSKPGVAEGAKLVVDGRGHAVKGYENGFFLGGSLFDGVTPAMKIYREEIFGPVLVVVRVPTLADAVKLVNSHEFANGTAVFTRDGGAARAFVQQIEVGMVGRQRADSRAHGVHELRRLAPFEFRGSRHAWHGRRALLHAAQDRHQPLARRLEEGARQRRIRHADDEVSAWMKLGGPQMSFPRRSAAIAATLNCVNEIQDTRVTRYFGIGGTRNHVPTAGAHLRALPPQHAAPAAGIFRAVAGTGVGDLRGVPGAAGARRRR